MKFRSLLPFRCLLNILNTIFSISSSEKKIRRHIYHPDDMDKQQAPPLKNLNSSLQAFLSATTITPFDLTIRHWFFICRSSNSFLLGFVKTMYPVHSVQLWRDVNLVNSNVLAGERFTILLWAINVWPQHHLVSQILLFNYTQETVFPPVAFKPSNLLIQGTFLGILLTL